MKSKFSLRSVAICLFCIIVGPLCTHFDLLSGFTEQQSLGAYQMQVAITSFCLSGAYKFLIDPTKRADDHYDPMQKQDGGFDFDKTGELPEEDYEKQSIYALLYGGYRNAGIVKDTKGKPYRFTFNTWGHAGGHDYGPEFPQRFGMKAYRSLAEMPAVANYVKNKPDAHFLEIGCGTGAGADLISRMVYPTIHYTALDMQKAAIETCVNLHAAHDNPHLSCVHSNGQNLPFPDNSVDVVVVSETHIAEMQIGPEEIAIFNEMKRVVVPGGLFVWGNALPTKVWLDSVEYLQSIGFQDCGLANYTAAAVEARDLDKDRVESFLDQLWAGYPVLSNPINGVQCRHTLDMLVKNFYRHPGTDLYQRMTVGADSYMNMCHKLN